MPNISTKAVHMPESPIRKLVPYAEKAKAQGKKVNPGDEVIIPEPFYANYNGFAVAAGLNVVPVTASIDSGFARDIVKEHDLFLFADEVYREFCYDGAVPFSVMNLEGIENNVIMIDSVSKRYSMCGARIGAIVSRNAEIMTAALKFAQARLSPPTLAQIASEGALDTPQSYFDEVVTEYVERRNTMVDGLNAIEGVFCPKPSGAFYCVAKFPVDNTEKFCQWLLESYDYNGETVMMAPASGFYATPGLGLQEARIAYVVNTEELKKAVSILENALKVYPGSTI